MSSSELGWCNRVNCNCLPNRSALKYAQGLILLSSALVISTFNVEYRGSVLSNWYWSNHIIEAAPRSVQNTTRREQCLIPGIITCSGFGIFSDTDMINTFRFKPIASAIVYFMLIGWYNTSGSHKQTHSLIQGFALFASVRTVVTVHTKYKYSLLTHCIKIKKLKAPRNLYWMSNMFLWVEIFSLCAIM